MKIRIKSREEYFKETREEFDQEYMSDEELKEWIEEREKEYIESEKATRARLANLRWPENLLNFVYGNCHVNNDGVEEVLDGLLNSVTPTEEKIFRLYFQEGKTCNEICAEFDAYFVSVINILSKGRRKLLLPARRKLVLDYIGLGSDKNKRL